MPSIKSSPLSGFIRAAIIKERVVLYCPDFPIIPIKSPFLISKLMLLMPFLFSYENEIFVYCNYILPLPLCWLCYLYKI